MLSKIISGVFIVLCICFFWSLLRLNFVVKSEKGFLGADNYGRRWFIHTLNYLEKDTYRETHDLPGTFDLSNNELPLYFSNEDEDNSFIEVLLYKPRSRSTSFRLNFNLPDTLEKSNFIDSSFMKTFCDSPIEEFSTAWLLYNWDYVIISEEDSLKPREFLEMASNDGCETVRDLLRGYGFKILEVYLNGKYLFSCEINNKVSNWEYCEFSATGGSLKNIPFY